MTTGGPPPAPPPGPPPPPCRLVVFDLDGTLADSFPWFRDVLLGELGREFGLPRADAAEVERLRGLASTRELLRRVGVPAWRVPALARRGRAIKARDAGRIPLFPGALDALRALRDAGTRLALVTSDAEANARRILGAEAAALFERLDCGAALFGKAARFRRVLAASGVAPAEALAVGDEPRDAEAARRAGLPFGAVSWGYARAEALAPHRPEALFAAMEDIAPWVAARGRRTGPGRSGTVAEAASAA